MLRIKRTLTMVMAVVMVITGIYTEPVAAYADELSNPNEITDYDLDGFDIQETDVSSDDEESEVIDDGTDEISETDTDMPSDEETITDEDAEPTEDIADNGETDCDVEPAEESEDILVTSESEEDENGDIVETADVASGTFGDTDNLTWAISDDYVLTVSGNGDMPDYSSERNTPWYSYKNNIKTIVIEDGVTAVGSNSFKFHDKVTSVTVGDTVLKINSNAFAYLSALTSLTLGDAITYIGKNAFDNCTNLTRIEIPSTVLTIDNYAFSNCKKVTDVIFLTDPEGKTSVTSIGERAFVYCEKLKNITLPDGITAIGAYAFNCCRVLEDIAIPTSVTSLGNGVFESCNALKSVSITFNASITSIPQDTFKYCNALTTLSFEGTDNITSIGSYAFIDCYELTGFTVYKNVTSIGSQSFKNCNKLAAITYETDSQGGITLNSIGDSAFYGCAFTTFSVTENVTTIGNNAFENCKLLETITLPNGITKIGSSAFKGCLKLKEVTVPTSVTSLGSYAFQNCEALTDATITFNNSLNSIPTGLFEGCSVLENITFNDPGNIKIVSSNAFKNCKKITTFTLYANVERIDSNVFEGCEALRSVTLNNKITVINSNLFKNCTALTTITVPASVTSINQNSFDGCTSLATIIVEEGNAYYYSKYNSTGAGGIYMKSTNALFIRPAGNTGVLDLEDGVTALSAMYFRGNTDITTLTIPASVTIIEDSALRDCTNLKTVIFAEGSSLTKIENNAFYNCTSLDTIVLPDGLIKIGSSAFYNCTSLTGIAIPAAVTDFNSNAFNNCKALTAISVAEGNTKWFSEDGIVYNKNSGNPTVFIWPSACPYIPTTYTNLDTRYQNNKNITEITIPANIETISNSAFSGCTSLKKITFAAGSPVTKIPSSFCYNCEALTSVNIPAGVTQIGSSAFYGCKELVSITLPSGITVIESNTFKDCIKLETFTMPSSLTSIKGNAFQNCYKLKNLTFPATLETIEGEAFRNCEAFTKINIPNSVTSINSDSFNGCKAVTDLTISNKITTIPSDAFSGMTALTNVVFNSTSSVSNINYYAFMDCTSLTSITLPKSVTSFATSAFNGCTALKKVNIEEGNTKYYSKDGIVYNKSNDNVYFKPAASSASVVEPAKSTYDASDYAKEKNKAVVTIPKAVTVIKADAFKNASKLTTVKFAKGSKLEKIEGNAFYGCSKLKSITLPGTVTQIGSRAFYGCTRLTSLSIPATVRSVGDYAFAYCTALATATVGSETTGAYMFSDCTKLKTIKLGGALKTIKASSFCNIPGLTAITIPGTIESIESSAFSGCMKLKKVTLPEGLTSIGSNAFSSTGVTELILPSTYTSVGSYAFYNMPALKKVTFKGEVAAIGNYAFARCSSLSAITIPASVKSIGARAFSESGLRTIELSEGLESIGSRCFEYTQLSKITIPEGVTEIPEKAFYSCMRLKEINISSTVTDIDLSAFDITPELECINVAKENTFYSSSDGVLYEDGVLIYCPAGWNETDELIVPESAKYISEYAFKGNDTIIDIVIPASVEEIGESAFESCTHLRTVTFEAGCSITSIPDSAFECCTDLNRVIFKGDTDIVSIGNRAFYGCSDLTEVSFDNNRKDIAVGTNAFYNCKSLTGIYSDGDVALLGSVGSSAFENCESITKIAFGASCTSISGTYTFYNGSSLKEFYVADGNPILYSIEGVLFCTGCYIGDAYYSNVLYRYPEARKAVSYTIPEGTTGVANYAFYNADDVDKIIFPDSLRAIGSHAFAYTNIRTYENVGELDILSLGAFYSSKITEIDLSGLTSGGIAAQCFYNCQSLTRVKLPSNMTSVAYEAFYNCTELKDMELPDTIENIYHGAYYNCDGLTQIVIPAGCVEIGRGCFDGCNGVTSIVFETYSDGTTDLRKIGFQAFISCNQVTEIVIPEGVETINAFAFSSCTKLSKISLPKTLTTLNTGNFSSGNYTYYGSFMLRYCNIAQIVINNPDLVIPNNFIFSSTDKSSASCKKKVYIYSDVSGSDGEKSSVRKYVENYSEGQCIPIFADVSAADDPARDPYLNGQEEPAGETSGRIDLFDAVKYSETGYSPSNDVSSGEMKWEYDSANKTLKLSVLSGAGVFLKNPTTYDYPWEGYRSEIRRVEFGAGVTDITYDAFYGYQSLREVDFSKDVVKIHSYAFENNNSLTTISFASECGVKEIGRYAFCGCKGLTSVVIPTSVEILANGAFSGCTGLTAITLHPGIKMVGTYAFSECTALTDIELYGTYTTGDSLFNNCTSLKNVIINEGITGLGSNSFSGTAIESLHIPASVTQLTTASLYGMKALKSITVAAGNDKFETIDGSLYEKETGKIIWRCPVTDVSGNNVLYIYKDFTLSDLTYSSDDSHDVVVVDPENEYFMEYENGLYSKDGKVLYYVPRNVKGVFTVKEGTGKINHYAFSYCKYLDAIILPESVYEINSNAFLGCRELRSINIPAAVTQIPSYCFSQCGNLRSIELHSGITSIGSYAFYYCSQLKRIKLPEGLKSIGNSAFYYCSDLQNVNIPAGVETLPSYCFYHCNNLTDVLFSEGLKSIGYEAFGYCSSLEYVTLPKGLKRIDDDAFYYSNGLKWVVIPESVEYIYGTQWYINSNGYYSNINTPFDYCGSALTIYVVEGSYAEYYVDGNYYIYTSGYCQVFDYDYISSDTYDKYYIDYRLNRAEGEENSPKNPTSYRNTDGSIVFEPAVKPGYTFEGWYRDSALKNKITSLVPAFEGDNIVLYPKWLKAHTVIMKADGLEDVSANIADGRSLEESGIEIPAKDGSRFTGWTDEAGHGFAHGDAVTADMVLTAEFAANNERCVYAPVSGTPSGMIASGSFVSLSTDTLGATIGYSIDGSEVVNANALAATALTYTDPVEIKGNAGDVITLKAAACADGLLSKTVVYSYTIIDTSNDWGDIAVSDRAGFASADDVPLGIWTSKIPETASYTGKKITFDLRVYHGRKLLKEKQDYTVKYKNNINVYTLDEGDEGFAPGKAPSVVITGKGNYKDSVTSYFIIEPADILVTQPVINLYNGSSSSSWFRYGYDEYDNYVIIPQCIERLAYNGKKQQYSPVLTYDGKKLKKNKDYTITYSPDNDPTYKNTGKYAFTVNGIGNFLGQVEAYYEIVEEAIPISKAKIKGFVAKQPYTSDTIGQKVVLTYNGEELVSYSDYYIFYTNNTEIGKATMTIYGMGRFKGCIKKTFTITGNAMKSVKVEGLEKAKPYTGREVQQPDLKLSRKSGKGKTAQTVYLIPGKDYSVSYTNNIKAGTATMIFTGKGAYTGTIKKTFKITPFDTGADAALKHPAIEVTMPEIIVYSKGGARPEPVVTYKGLVLKNGTDYKLSYKNNTKTGTIEEFGGKVPSVTVAFKGNFKGSRSLTFDIRPQNISKLSVSAKDMQYSGKAGITSGTVTVKDINGKALSEKTDFICSYFYNEPVTLTGGTVKAAGDEVGETDVIPAGASIRVKITGTAAYKGTTETVFNTAAADISKAKVTVNSDTAFVYTGSGIVPRKADITVVLNGVELSPSDYVITGGTNNIANGKKASFTIKGATANYGGTKTVTFTIDKKSFK